MSLTLDPILAAAQDSLERQPLVEIISAQFTEDIPFDGQLFNTDTNPETHPQVISMASGRIAVILTRDGGDLIYVRTNTEQTEWNETRIFDGGADDAAHATLCELTNGNIGIFWIRTAGSSYELKSMIIDPAGAIVSAAQTLATYATADVWVSAPFVVQQTDGTYLVVYAHETGGVYGIAKRTSTDFLSWGSQSLISPTGLDTSMRMDNPSLLQLSAGDLLLAFDYLDSVSDSDNKLVNCYLMSSSDGGSTWSAPENVTGYTDQGTCGRDPVMAERTDGSLEFVFHEENHVLKMEESDPAWQSCDCTECGLSSITDLHFDPATNKLYAKNQYTYVGTKALCAALVIDVDTWEIDKCYSCSTSPALAEGFACGSIDYANTHDEGPYIVAFNGNHIMLIDTDADTIRYYHFVDDAALGVTQNIRPDFKDQNPTIMAAWLDAATQRLYLLWSACGYVYTPYTWFGYIDITEPVDPISGLYSAWHEILYTTRYDCWNFLNFDSMTIVPEANMVMISCNSTTWATGRLHIYSLTSGGELHDFHYTDSGSFHRNGIQDPVYANNHIYGGISGYESGYGMGDYRGLMDIDLATDVVTYHRPSWATLDDYKLSRCRALADGRILMIAYGYGITVFNPADGSWELYNNTSVPGLCDGYYTFYDVDYDPVTHTVFTGGIYAPPFCDQGIFAFKEEGSFKQCKYQTGTYTTQWEFNTPTALVNANRTYEPAVAIDAEGALWGTWTVQSGAEYSTTWDKEAPTFELSDFLTGSVTAAWSIDAPAKLTFSLSRGHLFDPSNLMSTLRPFVQKGRRVLLRFGERIAGIEYWQAQGSFVVTETAMAYKRGTYPIMTVRAEDFRAIWREGNITASEYYSDVSPADVVQDLVETFGQMTADQIDLSALTGHTLYHQFIDQSLEEMTEAVFDHFGCFAYMDMDGKFTVRRIDLATDVDHTLGDTEIIEFTPDDSYSSFVNRVVVRGEGRYFVEVLYDLEAVTTVSGTTGWWGKKKTLRVWYADDHEQTYKNPKLEVLLSIRDFALFIDWCGGYEFISDEDPDGRWVEITIESPDLTGTLIAAVAATVLISRKALSCTTHCGIFIYAGTMALVVVLFILASVASYNYEIWAMPCGREKQTFQAEANDYGFQRQINNQVVTEEIDDPFCYTVQSCQTVADQELAVVMAQRNRIKFNKIAHLQDEIGDVVQLSHPYSGSNVTVFVTNLTRTFIKAENGYFTDQIEGWRI
jgi:hypothetical protein